MCTEELHKSMTCTKQHLMVGRTANQWNRQGRPAESVAEEVDMNHSIKALDTELKNR